MTWAPFRTTSPSRRTEALAVALALWLAGTEALAHGSVKERIAETTSALHTQPNDAALYARRGALHLLDRNWTQAAQDFEEAKDIDPQIADVDVPFANALIELGEHERVVALLDAALAERAHADGFVVRARALAALGQYERAASDFTAAISHSATPMPRTYRERAQAIAARGPEHRDAAVESLREGMKKLGPVVSLVEMAIDLRVEQGRYDAALELCDALEAELRQAPRWIMRRAAILERAGRLGEANAAYQMALESIDHRHRPSPALAALRSEVVAARARLGPLLGASAAAGSGLGAGWLGSRWLLAAVCLLGAVCAIAAARRFRRRE